MKKCLPFATFSIFGDLAQSIYDYRGINNWDEVNDALNDIDTLWQKYEIVMRVLNNKSVSDDFILHLDQCKLLSKYKKDNALEYLSILKDDIKDMMHVIPNP